LEKLFDQQILAQHFSFPITTTVAVTKQILRIIKFISFYWFFSREEEWRTFAESAGHAVVFNRNDCITLNKLLIGILFSKSAGRSFNLSCNRIEEEGTQHLLGSLHNNNA